MPARHECSSVRRSFARGPALAALLVLLATAPAAAATYYVAPGGSDANPGTAAAPWASLAKANATLVAGDVVHIGHGTYGDPIQPVNNGTAGARISYVGDVANPGSIALPSIFVNKAWVSVKGVGLTTSCMLFYTSESAKAWHDSIAYCRTPGLSIWGAQDCMVARCGIDGEIAILQDKGYAGPPDPAVSSPARDTLRGNVVTATISTKGFALRGDAQNCLIEGNTFRFSFDAAHGGDCQGRYLYNAQRNVLRGNRWIIDATGPLPGGAQYTGFALRDSSSDNLFDRDTVECGLQSGNLIGGRLVNSGNAAWVGQCHGNHWTGCVFRTTGYVFNQDLLNGAVIENCVFASNQSWALYLGAPVQNTLIRNCTIVSWAGPALKVDGDLRLGGNQIHSNIFRSGTVGACYSGRAVVSHGYPTGFAEDDNLFYATGADAGVTASDQAVYWSSSACSAVGAGTAWASTGNDVHSKFGAPMFVDGNWATFDAHLQPGSPAIGLGQNGTEAGAFGVGAPTAPGGGGGGQPPAAPPVADLAIVQCSDHAALLAWTARPGEQQYEIRISRLPISPASLDLAARAGEPAVSPGGGRQSFPLTGLAPFTAYFVAIRSRDAAGHWGPIAVLRMATTATDQVPPAPIHDLH